eukprot:m.135362 g.135362  ORF g.135362 m.135362 type:complete len:471 (-) comp14868_c3_seq1:35-1447(-)
MARLLPLPPARFPLAVAVLCLSLCTFARSFSLDELGLGVDGSQNPLFNIDFVAQFSGESSSKMKALTMKTANNEEYECFVPVTDPGEQKAETAAVEIDPATLYGSNEPCFLLMEPYWTYEYCPNRHVRQFHKTEESINGVKRETYKYEFFLGRTITGHSSPSTRMAHKGEQLMYVTQTYSGGTPCDLTGQARETVVHFVCGVVASFADVAETSTCRYAIIVETPALCKHQGYAPPKREVERIQCVAKQAAVTPRALQQIHDEQVEAARVAAEARARTSPQTTLDMGDETTHSSSGPRVVLPQPPDAHAQTAQPAVDPPVSASTAAASKETLRRMLRNNHCFVGGDGGWWRFEFCFHRHVRQFHVNEDGTNTNIMLGTWDEAYHREQFVTRREEALTKRSVSQYLGKGDFCQETNQHRQTQVRLVCSRALSPSQVSLALTEPATCRYVLTVQSQVFCDILDTVDDNGKFSL